MSRHPGLTRLLVAVLVLGGEYELLAVQLDGGALVAAGGAWAAIGRVGFVVSLFATIATSGVLLTRRSVVEELSGVARSLGRYDWRWGVVHAACYVAFAFCSTKLFAVDKTSHVSTGAWFFAWLASGAATVGSLLGFVAPRGALGLARVALRIAVAGLALGVVAWFVALRALELWPLVAKVTLGAVAALLGMVSDTVVVDESQHVIGADGFSVEIAPFCSGIEGMALIFLFVSAYLLRFRKRLSFPRALVLLPISVAFAFAANVLRISALILVGAHVSPDVAFGGFHSKAGWFMFCGIALLVVAIVEWTGFFVRDVGAEPASERDLTPYYLLPELTVLGVSLSTGLFASGVDFLYPLRIVCAAVVLAVVAKQLREVTTLPTWKSVPLGAAVFGVWLLLSPRSSPLAAELRDALMQLSPLSRWVFVIFRVAGSVIVVPIAEELAFRGYLQRRLVAEDFTSVSLRSLPVLPVVATALCFGVLHGSLVAGTIASLAYSGAAYFRGRLVDAVAAHATTNALIAVWVLVAGRWDLWT